MNISKEERAVLDDKIERARNMAVDARNKAESAIKGFDDISKWLDKQQLQ